MKRHKRSATVSSCTMPCCENTTKKQTGAKRTKTKTTTKSTVTKSKKNSRQNQQSDINSLPLELSDSEQIIQPNQSNTAKKSRHTDISRNRKRQRQHQESSSSSSDSDSEPRDSATESDRISDESDDDSYPFGNVLDQHANNLLAGIPTTQFVEPVSTPISHSISKSIRKKIQHNKFVDFSLLLPNSGLQHAPNYAFSVNSRDQLSLIPASPSKKITSIETWTTAFLRFVAIYTTSFPNETPQLMKYGEIVRDLARRRPGLAWSFYDSQFRMFREHELMPWDRLHTEFWIMATTQPYSTGNSYQSHRPFQSGSSRSFRPNTGQPRKQSKFLENTCWTYNRRGLCREPRCSHPHVCGFCRGSHHSGLCSFTSKEQANASVSHPAISHPTQQLPGVPTPSNNRKK